MGRHEKHERGSIFGRDARVESQGFHSKGFVGAAAAVDDGSGVAAALALKESEGFERNVGGKAHPRPLSTRNPRVPLFASSDVQPHCPLPDGFLHWEVSGMRDAESPPPRHERPKAKGPNYFFPLNHCK